MDVCVCGSGGVRGMHGQMIITCFDFSERRHKQEDGNAEWCIKWESKAGWELMFGWMELIAWNTPVLKQVINPASSTMHVVGGPAVQLILSALEERKMCVIKMRLQPTKYSVPFEEMFIYWHIMLFLLLSAIKTYIYQNICVLYLRKR